MTPDALNAVTVVRTAYPALDVEAASVFLGLCAWAPLSGRRLAKRLMLPQSQAFRALAMLVQCGLILAEGETDALTADYVLSASGERLKRRLAGV